MMTLPEPDFDLEAGRGGEDDTPRRSGSSDGTEIAGLVPEDIESNRVDGGGDVHLLKEVENEKDCRICHLSLSEESGNGIIGIAIELGCSCKDDLAAAHKHCAEAWFKIKGNRTCEICGSIARNVAGGDEVEPVDQWNEPNGPMGSQAATAPSETMATSEAHSLWQGHRFLNILLASMVFAFVISWLFHFNVPS
ncbi:uncharacterized protein LOC143563187 [Bidens hawaiensis]|uniref:uncharacterized protein LOC143563187 n=1 Tax=Bidens hawaiensis TaxID=980011 RepID=UPI00404A1638